MRCMSHQTENKCEAVVGRDDRTVSHFQQQKKQIFKMSLFVTLVLLLSISFKVYLKCLIFPLNLLKNMLLF